MDDDDTIEELKSIKQRDFSEGNSEITDPSPGPSASSENQPSGDNNEDDEEKLPWPSITDLNTRLRRVITSYQRNYRKEEQKLQAVKAASKVSVSIKIPLIYYLNSVFKC